MSSSRQKLYAVSITNMFMHLYVSDAVELVIGTKTSVLLWLSTLYQSDARCNIHVFITCLHVAINMLVCVEKTYLYIGTNANCFAFVMPLLTEGIPNLYTLETPWVT